MKQKFNFSNTGVSHKTQACPVAYSEVDKHLIKAYSSTVLLVLIFTLFTGNHVAMYLITIDFLARVFIGIKYSPLCSLLTSSLRITRLKPLLVNAGSKRVAAQIGLIFCVSICGFHFFGFPIIATVFLLLFVLAISLDLIFDYCLACKMQSLYFTYVKRYL